MTDTVINHPTQCPSESPGAHTLLRLAFQVVGNCRRTEQHPVWILWILFSARHTRHHIVAVHVGQGGSGVMDAEHCTHMFQSHSTTDDFIVWLPQIGLTCLIIFMISFEPCRIYAKVLFFGVINKVDTLTSRFASYKACCTRTNSCGRPTRMIK